MKKLVLILLIVAAVLIFPMITHAAGTCSVTPTSISRDFYCITYTWTADASDGSVPATASPKVTGYVVLAITDPGATAPTDNYDITLTDEDDVDVFGGNLANRDTANSEHAVPKIGSVYGGRFVNSALTMNLSNNSVNSATGELKVYIAK